MRSAVSSGRRREGPPPGGVRVRVRVLVERPREQWLVWLCISRKGD